MQEKTQLVSILLPIWNAERFLPDCLDSLLNQSYQQIEIIAIDDNSRDHSLSILQRYKKKAGRKLKISQNVKRYGIAITLNRALKKAKGKYITFTTPQDISTRDRIKRQMNYLLSNPKTVAVGTQCFLLNEHMKKIGKSEFPLDHENIAKQLLGTKPMHFESALINSYLLPKDLLYFNPNTNTHFFVPLFLKMLQYGGFANVDQALYMHVHKGKDDLQLKFASSLFLWIKAHVEYDVQLPFQSLFYPLLK